MDNCDCQLSCGAYEVLWTIAQALISRRCLAPAKNVLSHPIHAREHGWIITALRPAPANLATSEWLQWTHAKNQMALSNFDCPWWANAISNDIATCHCFRRRGFVCDIKSHVKQKLMANGHYLPRGHLWNKRGQTKPWKKQQPCARVCKIFLQACGAFGHSSIFGQKLSN